MMDADSLFPKGYHPVQSHHLPDASALAPQLWRAKGHIKYYYVDFGISVHLPTDSPKLVVGGYGRDQDVPELSFDVPYDPFKVDIFILGNMFKREIYDVGRPHILWHSNSNLTHSLELLQRGFLVTFHQCDDPK